MSSPVFNLQPEDIAMIRGAWHIAEVVDEAELIVCPRWVQLQSIPPLDAQCYIAHATDVSFTFFCRTYIEIGLPSQIPLPSQMLHPKMKVLHHDRTSITQ